jgi:hypothetical protein
MFAKRIVASVQKQAIPIGHNPTKLCEPMTTRYRLIGYV